MLLILAVIIAIAFMIDKRAGSARYEKIRTDNHKGHEVAALEATWRRT